VKRLSALRRSLQRHLTWPHRPWVVWGETVTISLVIFGLGLWLRPLDPLGVNAPFPWGWFAPALVALRHGAIAAMVSALLMVLGQSWVVPLSWDDAGFQLHLLGGLSLTLLLSQFAGSWHNRAIRQAELVTFAEEQLHALTREHFLLRLSHERLEQELLMRPGSLTDAIAAMDSALLAMSDDSPLPQAERLLHLLAEYCRLDAAAIHVLDAQGNLQTQPVASIGRTPPPDVNDPLVAQALTSGQLVHVANAEDRSDAAWLVAAPVHGTHGARGVLLVRDMPFLAVEPENLQTLGLLLTAYGDLAERERLIAPLLAQAPSCPPDFAFALHRIWRAHLEAGLDSHLITLQAPRSDAVAAWFDELPSQKRMLDVYWSDPTPDTLRLHILLPLGSQLQADGVLDRLELRWQLQRDFDPATVRLRTEFRVVDLPPPEMLQQLVRGRAA
jgi:hypothetical protein